MLWSDIKVKFENEVLCPALRGRVRFEYTDYSDDADIDDFFLSKDVNLRDNCLAIYADGKLIYAFNTKDYTEQFATMNGHLRHTIQRILSENYVSHSAAVEASWDIVNEYIPWLSSQKGIMRAEHAVRNMKEFIDNPHYDLTRSNEFVFVLWYLSKYISSKVVLSNMEASSVGFAETWFYPLVRLRIEAEQTHQDKLKQK